MDYVDDLDRFLTHVEQVAPGKPVFLFGHSMGGAVATLAAERHAPKLAGLVLSGPLLALDAPPLLLATVRMLGALLPSSPTLTFDPHDFSSDPAVVAAMEHDAWISHEPGPSSTTAGILDGVHRIWAGADALTMPMLVMHGTRDLLTAPSGSRALVARAPATDKTLRIYDGAFHILLHEPNGVGARVTGDIVAWLDAHTGGAAVAAPAPYEGALVGDPRGWTQAFELAAGASDHGFAGSLAVNLARPAPIGWSGAFTARMADGDYRALSLRPLGVAARAGGAVLGLSAGAALVTGTHAAMSGGAWLEVPAGPVHLGATAEWSRLFSNSSGAAPLGADELWLSGSLRLGGDRAYWPGAHAGVGPAVFAGSEWTGSANGWFAMLGLQMYGSD
jgi:acylglycerol lipase